METRLLPIGLNSFTNQQKWLINRRAFKETGDFMHDPEYLDYLQQFMTPELFDRFDEVLTLRTRKLTVVLENLYHRHNASACLRSCDAFGIQDVQLIEGGCEFKTDRKIDLGSARWLTISRYDEDEGTKECLHTLRDQGYRIVATTLDPHAHTPETLPLDGTTAIVFGGEKEGVSQSVLDEADALLSIPMTGFVQSLNVSVAVAIITQRLTTRLRETQSNWGLTEAEKAELRNVWLERAARHRHPRLVEQYWRDRRAKA